MSSTATQVCALRALESRKPEGQRLIFDPLASVLCGGVDAEAADWLHSAGRPAEFWIDFMAVRTRWIDDALELAAPSQVVILGAGLDSRAHRLEALRGVPVFEVDFGEVLEAKQALLSSGPAPLAALRRVPANLGVEGWTRELAAAGLQAGEPSVWLLEGLSGYLTEPELRTLLGGAASAASQGSEMIVTFVGPELMATSMHRFSVADEGQVNELLDSCGWAAAEVRRIGALSRGYGRTETIPPDTAYFLASASRKLP